MRTRKDRGCQIQMFLSEQREKAVVIKSERVGWVGNKSQYMKCQGSRIAAAAGKERINFHTDCKRTAQALLQS